jgi:hypothetical protein
MQKQPFAHKIATPVSNAPSGTDGAKTIWLEKKEGDKCEKRLIVQHGNVIEWFGDEAQKDKRGTLKCDSIMSVDKNGLEIVLATATKSHTFKFNNQVKTFLHSRNTMLLKLSPILLKQSDADAWQKLWQNKM